MPFKMLIAAFAIALLTWGTGYLRARSDLDIIFFWLGVAGIYLLPLLVAPLLALLPEAKPKVVFATLAGSFLWSVWVAVQVRLMFSGPMFGGRVSPLAAFGVPLLCTSFMCVATMGIAMLLREAGVRTSSIVRFNIVDVLCMSAVFALLAALAYAMG